MDYYNFNIFSFKARIIEKEQYGKISTIMYFLKQLKEFVTSLCDCYQDEVDEPLSYAFSIFK